MSDTITWYIPHPGTMERLDIPSFEEGMSKWFEGFNLPRMVVNGVTEDFTISHARVKAWFKSTGMLPPTKPTTEEAGKEGA